MKKVSNPIFKVLAAIQAYAIKLAKQKIEQQCAEYADELVNSIEDKNKRNFVAPLMKNQLSASLTTAYDILPGKQQDLQTKLVYTHERNCKAQEINHWLNMACQTACKIYDQYQPLVGLQPMQGPVGLMYSMQYKERELDEGVTTTLEIVSQAVTARSMKLDTSWSLEAVMDMKTMHNIDLADELGKAVSSEVTEEYGRYILHTIREQAAFNDTVEAGGELSKQLISSISTISNYIAAKTKRGMGNVLYVHPSMYAVFELYNVIEPISDCYTIVTDYHCREDEIIIGYKGGNSEIDAGLFFNPYMLLVDAGIVTDTKTFQPRQSIMTRFDLVSTSAQQDEKGNVEVLPNPYYGVITVNGLVDSEQSKPITKEAVDKLAESQKKSWQ